jgi:hypothetical protein
MEETEQLAPQESTPEPEEDNSLFPETNDEAQDTDPVEAPEVDDSEEIDHEGEKYKLPKKLAEEWKNGRLRQQDYTVKTQDLAKQKTEFETAQQEFVARQQFQQQHIQAVAKVMAIDERLEQFQKLDWNALTDADPVQALKLDRQMRELQQQRAQQIDGLQQSQAKLTFEQQQATARRQQEAREELSKDIPGFGTAEVQKQLLEVGKAAGYKQEELASVQDPRAVKLLHKAYLYDQLIAKAKAPATTSANITPITRVTGASAATQKSIGDKALSDAEYNRMRREYIARNR